MTLPTPDRIAWLAENILPHEPALRLWLEQPVFRGLDCGAVIQETYGELARLPSVSHIKAPRRYAFNVARTVVLRRQGGGAHPPIEGGADLDEAGKPPPPMAAAGDLLARLPAACRDVLMLRKVEGLTQRQTAKRLGVSEGAVHRRMTRAIRILMGVLAQEQVFEGEPETI